MPKSKLVQIKTEVTPLRQSTEQIMACPTFYVETFIKGRKQPGGLDSARGTQIHHVLSQIASWCAARGIGQDLQAFDSFARGVGPQAERILAGLRDGYSVDHKHLLATELPMSLDESLQPTRLAEAMEGFCPDSQLPVSYEGTLDALYLFRDEYRAEIHDAKSHMKPFQPDDTLQGRMYALFVFQHFAWINEVKFRLIFVRYKNLYREVVYTRSDVPMLIDVVKAARARQLMLHEDYAANRDIEAIPGPYCGYCPMLANRTCPISEFNPAMQLSPSDRLKFNLWYSAFSRVNNAALKDYVQATGKPVILRDYNKKSYVYGPQEKEANVYPLFQATADGIATDGEGNPVMPIASLLMDYANMPENADDRAWLGKLTISSTKLEGYLKAKSRVHVHQAIQDTADKVTKVSLKVSKPLDSVPEPAEDEDDNEWDEEDF